MWFLLILKVVYYKLALVVLANILKPQELRDVDHVQLIVRTVVLLPQIKKLVQHVILIIILLLIALFAEQEDVL
jgi:hypothetical protein